MVVIALSINQMWKQKKRVTIKPKKIASVSPNSNKNILKNGVSGEVAALSDAGIVHMIMWQAMAE